MKMRNQFTTSDLALAATLAYHGFVIETMDRSNPNRTVFQFRHDDGLDDLVQAFWAHAAQVDPINYFLCLKEVKTRLYSPSC